MSDWVEDACTGIDNFASDVWHGVGDVWDYVTGDNTRENKSMAETQRDAPRYFDTLCRTTTSESTKQACDPAQNPYLGQY